MGSGVAAAAQQNPYLKQLQQIDTDHAAAAKTSANISARTADAQAAEQAKGMAQAADNQDFILRTQMRVQDESQARRMEAGWRSAGREPVPMICDRRATKLDVFQTSELG